jgi:TrmH family RNA methyltransferase
MHISRKTIHKRSDPLARRIREVRDGRNTQLMMAEGPKIIEEALRSQAPFDTLVCDQTAMPRHEKLLRKIDPGLSRTYLMKNNVMTFVSDLKSPPGILALIKRPSPHPLEFSDHKPALILILHQLQLPQNVGGLIRTAEAAGVTQMILTGKTADPFGPKAIRGSSGSIFRMSIHHAAGITNIFKVLKKHKIPITGLTPKGKEQYTQINWKQPIALVLGSEGSGFELNVDKEIKTTVQIPMEGSVESLNVAAAGAICLYEAHRQRVQNTQ